jgi:outer membrane lipoprotein-sorting protein
MKVLPLVLLVPLLACSSLKHKRPEKAIEDPAVIIQALRSNPVGSLRVLGTLDMRQEGKRVKAHMVYVIKNSTWFRFETESFFDQPLSILVSDGRQFTAWDIKKSRVIQGQATPENISRVIPLPMTGAEIAGILSGNPALNNFSRSTLSWDFDRGLYRLQLSSENSTQTVLVDPKSIKPVETFVEKGGELVYKLSYSQWLKDNIMPGRLQFEMPSRKIIVRMRIKEAQPDPAIKDSLFQLHPPKGIPIEYWD